MEQYKQTTDEDLLLLQWWATMRADEELEKIFWRGAGRPAVFLSLFQPPSGLLYEVDEQGIWFAWWGAPYFSGVRAGLWVRQDRRETLAAAAAYREALERTFEVATVIVFETCQEHVWRICQALGYNAMEVAGLWDGRPMWLLTLTQEEWRTKHGRRWRIANS